MGLKKLLTSFTKGIQVFNVVNEAIDQVDKNTEAVSGNTNAISQNTENIEKNTEAIDSKDGLILAAKKQSVTEATRTIRGDENIGDASPKWSLKNLYDYMIKKLNDKEKKFLSAAFRSESTNLSHLLTLPNGTSTYIIRLVATKSGRHNSSVFIVSKAYNSVSINVLSNTVFSGQSAVDKICITGNGGTYDNSFLCVKPIASGVEYYITVLFGGSTSIPNESLEPPVLKICLEQDLKSKI